MATAHDPQKLLKDALSKLSALATLPEITAKIIATVEDPKSSASQLHKIVSHDPALISRILKVVNSAFYGLPGQIASVERAIVMLGLTAIKNIAVAASLGQMFRGVKLCDGFTAKDLWSHCVAVAVVSRDLAKQINPGLAEEAFLAGMIHDIGLLVSLQTWPEQIRATCDKSQVSPANFIVLENEIVGVNHQLIGQALAEKWSFPVSCQMVSGHHHDPAGADERYRLLVAIVYVADTLCCTTAGGFNLTAMRQVLDETAIIKLGLDPQAVQRTRDNLTSTISNANTLVA